MNSLSELTKEQLKKQSQDFIKLPVWDTYYYSSGLLRKKMEDNIPGFLDKNKKYKILDYGCGVRPYEYIFDDYQSEYTGVDVGINPHADIRIEPDEKLPFNDGEYDLIYSNSLFEHINNSDEQKKLAEEIKRIGKHYFIQTPNYYFPLEPHFLFPFFQFLPDSLKQKLIMSYDLGWYKKQNDEKKAKELADSVRLLKKSELKEMFPGCKIYYEKYFLLNKSFIIYS